MTLQEQIVDAATELGFEIIGWDDTHAGVRGVGVEFVGTHAELKAYLAGWIDRQGQNPRMTRRCMLSLSHGRYSPAVLLPGTTFQIYTRPQVYGFKGERVAIPDEIARYFIVNDITVGNRSCFPVSGPLPGGAFATRIQHSTRFDLLPGDCMSKLVMTEEASEEFGRAIDMDPCQTAMDVAAIVTVVDDAPPDIQFEMLILGSCAHRMNDEHNLPPLNQAPAGEAALTRDQIQQMIDAAWAARGD